MKLIGIAGMKSSGKGTAARFVAEWALDQGLLAVEHGFADKLKWATARIFWPKISLEDAITWADRYKNADGAAVEVWCGHSFEAEITGRELFQHAGTEMGRQIFGDNFWVDQLLPISSFRESFAVDHKIADVGMISDVRFPNEARRIFDLGGRVWMVRRPGHEPDGHASEALLPPRFVSETLDNDSDLDALRALVGDLCERTLR